MKITVIGAGNAFSKKNFNQSFLIEEDGRKLLVDCGAAIPMALYEQAYDLFAIDDIYISHQHADHIGGLEEVAFQRYDWAKRPTHWSQGKYAPRLIANEGLLKDLWETSLLGGLKSMEGFEATLETFFETMPLKPNEKFMWQGWDVELVQQIHVMAGNTIMHTYGLIFERKGHKTVYLTTDSQHCSPRQLNAFYSKADFIIQDCELVGCNFQFKEGEKVWQDPETKNFHKWPTDEMQVLELMAKGLEPQPWKVYRFGSGVHANYAELAAYPSANHIQLPLAVRNKMWLSHYQDFKELNVDYTYKVRRYKDPATHQIVEEVINPGHPVNWDEQAKADGFQGFLKVGQEFEF